MNKLLLVMIAIIVFGATIVMATNSTFDDELTVEFGTINCSDSSAVVFQISNNDYTIARYTVYCTNNSITAEYVQSEEGRIDVDDKITDNMMLDDTEYFDTDEQADDKITSTFEPDLSTSELTDFCSSVDTGGSVYDSLTQNLSYCYNSLQKMISVEETCIDNSGLAGEYRAKYESCNTDYTECNAGLTTIKNERDTYQKDSNDCNSELVSTQSSLTNCDVNKATLTTEKNDYQNKSEQRIMYALGGAALAGIAVYAALTKGKRDPDHNLDEQEGY